MLPGKPQSLNLTEEEWEAMKSSGVIKFDKRLMSDLTEKSNRVFKGLCNHRSLSQKKSLNFFSFSFKSACCLCKMHLLRKIHERLFDVVGRPVISNGGTLTEKVSDSLDHYLIPVIKEGSSYIKDTQGFLEKLNIQIKCHLMLF